jgi:hypothetical protein
VLVDDHHDLVDRLEQLLGDPVLRELGAKAQPAVVNSLGSKALPPCSPCWNPCMPALL